MTRTEAAAAGDLRVWGQCITAKEVLLARFQPARAIADLVPLLSLDDNYVAVFRRGREVFIVNSFYSLSAYFYAAPGGSFFHGDTIHALARTAPKGAVDLGWDFEAIGDQLGFQHLIGDETLARGVRLVPQGAILHWDGERLHKKTFAHQDFLAELPHPRVEEILVERLLDGLRAIVGPRPLLTCSSGLDSRVNLAGMLHLGMRPELSVMGVPTAKDVEVVFAMAKAFDLKVNHVELDPRLYVDAAIEIARETNGVKPVGDWHSHAFPRSTGYTKDDHVVMGNNGEHVRAISFDYGALALGLDALSRHDGHLLTGPLMRKLWDLRTWPSFHPDELSQCNPALLRYYRTRRQSDKLYSVIPEMSFVSQTDAFVLEQRRKGFQACGLRLFGMFFQPVSPYMRKPWIDAGWSLGLPWRLGSRWHRYAVEELCPKLLDFPEEKETDRLRRTVRPLQWVPRLNRVYRRPTPVPYMDQHALKMRSDVIGLLADHASHLEEIAPRAVIDRIVDEQRRTGERSRLFGILAAMAVWRESLRDVHAAAPPTP